MCYLAARTDFTSRIGTAFSHIAYKRAVEEEYLREIYHLRYISYCREGAIEPAEEEFFTDDCDEDPNVFIFGVESGNRLAASIRMHICSAEMPFAPALDVFPDLLRPILERGESFVDPTRFVIDRTLRESMGHMPFATIRLAAMAAEHFDVDHVLATVRAEHAPFYQRFCDMDLIGGPRAYPGLKKPICLLAGASERIRESVYARYDLFSSTHRERTRLFGPSRHIGLRMTETFSTNDNRVPAAPPSLSGGPRPQPARASVPEAR